MEEDTGPMVSRIVSVKVIVPVAAAIVLAAKTIAAATGTITLTLTILETMGPVSSSINFYIYLDIGEPVDSCRALPIRHDTRTLLTLQWIASDIMRDKTENQPQG